MESILKYVFLEDGQLEERGHPWSPARTDSNLQLRAEI